jgi:hypothetical protein
MKTHRRKHPISVAVSIIGGLAFIGVIFFEDLRIVTGISIIKLNASKLHGIYNSTMLLRRGIYIYIFFFLSSPFNLG